MNSSRAINRLNEEQGDSTRMALRPSLGDDICTSIWTLTALGRDITDHLTPPTVSHAVCCQCSMRTQRSSHGSTWTETESLKRRAAAPHRCSWSPNKISFYNKFGNKSEHLTSLSQSRFTYIALDGKRFSTIRHLGFSRQWLFIKTTVFWNVMPCGVLGNIWNSWKITHVKKKK
jgi:hypothetical protein